MHVVGIDVGGTFTDVTAADEATGTVVVTKVPSRPGGETAAVLAGLHALGIAAGDVRRLVHGTTAGTNAILERRGARVALLTTEGFRDLVEIGRTKRNIPVLFVPTFIRPRPVVPRARRFEVAERMGPDGAPIVPLTGKALEAAVDRVAAAAPEAVAVCFLHAYTSPAHERQAGERLGARLPGVPCSLSSDVVPEYREFERFSTTVLNAYLQPLMDRALAALEEGLAEAGYRHGVLTIGSSGGTMTVDTARRLPIRTIFSGPAGGVGQACLLAERLGLDDLITYDMGGTSTDVCLVRGRVPVTTTDNLVGAFPVKVPQLDIRTVGAGGGSVAWRDIDGSLGVGPRSAGARPGPAAYGLGGTEPTVTDANVVLGRIAAGRTLGGAITISAPAAAAAFARLAAALGGGIDVHALAGGVLRIAVARMTSSIREVSIERGHDPRDFTLVAFGGAGPMHACAVADELEMPRILVPRHPGNFSALGLLGSDIRHDDVRTCVGRLRTHASRLPLVFAPMEAAARARLEKEGFEAGQQRLERVLELRYAGQAFEVAVPVADGAVDAAAVEREFHARHEAAYGHSDPGGTVELVNARLTARGVVRRPEPAPYRPGTTRADEALRERRNVWFAGRAGPTPVYERERLPVGASLAGPAVLDEFGATTVVAPGWRATADELGHLRLERAR